MTPDGWPTREEMEKSPNYSPGVLAGRIMAEGFGRELSGDPTAAEWTRELLDRYGLKSPFGDGRGEYEEEEDMPITPADPQQCQAEVPNGNTFMTLGGQPGRVRCTNRPVVVAVETEPNPEDGEHGEMSLCADCLAKLSEQERVMWGAVKVKALPSVLKTDAEAISRLLHYSFRDAKRTTGGFYLEDLTAREREVIKDQETYDRLLTFADLVELG